jgi:hypothetical protein
MSNDLSEAFFTRWLLMCTQLDIAPLDLLRVAYSESGCLPNAHNPNGHAVGLIQFMPATLNGLGWTGGYEAFRSLRAEDQVPFVEAYFRPWAHRIGVGGQRIPQLTSDAHCYVATFLPGTLPLVVAAGDNFRDVTLCGLGGPLAWAYKANTVLDRDHDGRITPGDLEQHLFVQCRGARYASLAARLAAAARPSTIPPEPIVHPAVPLGDSSDSEPPDSAA